MGILLSIFGLYTIIVGAFNSTGTKYTNEVFSIEYDTIIGSIIFIGGVIISKLHRIRIEIIEIYYKIKINSSIEEKNTNNSLDRINLNDFERNEFNLINEQNILLMIGSLK